MTINQSFQNWEIITDEPGEELIIEHEDPETGNKDRMVFSEDAGIGTDLNPVPVNGVETASPSDGFSGVQSVLDSMSDAEWTKLKLVPGGEYSVDSVERLETPDKTIIDGQGATLVGNGNEATDAHLLLTNKDWSTESSDIIVRDLNVHGEFTDGSGAKSTSYGGLVQFTNADSITLNELYIENGYRHNLQLTKCTNSTVKETTCHAAQGDDNFSVSDGGAELGGTLGAAVSEYVHLVNCTSTGVQTPDSDFEVDDGPSKVFHIGCVATSPVANYSVKVHVDDTAPRDIYYDNCVGNFEIKSDPDDDITNKVQHITITDCYSSSPVFFRGVDNIELKGGSYVRVEAGATSGGLQCKDVTVSGAKMTSTGSNPYVLLENADAVTVKSVTTRSFAPVVGAYPDTGETVDRLTVTDINQPDGTEDVLDATPVNSGTIGDVKVSDCRGESVTISSAVSDARLSNNVLNSVTDNGTRTRINGVGSETANAEEPTAASWDTGNVVDFTDSGDGSGDGVYKLLPDGTWSQIGT